MTGNFNSDLFFILLVLIVAALLGFLIGWLSRSSKLKALKASLDACYKSNEDLKRDKPMSFESSIEAKKPTPIVSSSVVATSSNEISFDSALAKGALGKVIKENDLKIVEGIGPKIEELLNNDGIRTWKQLGQAPVSRLQKILTDAGDRFSFHKPDTWPKQSKLAAEGKWEELKKLQDYLDGGKEPSK